MAAVATQAYTTLICAACQEARPRALSCIHTFTGSGASDLAHAPAFEGPCEHPQGGEWRCRAWRDVPGPAAEHPADSCRLYASAGSRALAVRSADAWPIVTPPADPAPSVITFQRRSGR